jgi:hypothetical protein
MVLRRPAARVEIPQREELLAPQVGWVAQAGINHRPRCRGYPSRGAPLRCPVPAVRAGRFESRRPDRLKRPPAWVPADVHRHIESGSLAAQHLVGVDPGAAQSRRSGAPVASATSPGRSRAALGCDEPFPRAF